jgi:hypothetical protein
MSANQQLYALMFGGINGAILVEEQSIDVKRTANAQLVMTVAKGFAGVSPGAGMVHVDIKNALPVAGPEFDAGNSILGLIQVNVQVMIGGAGGKKMKGKAFILEDTWRHGVNQEASYEFSCVMSPQLFT